MTQLVDSDGHNNDAANDHFLHPFVPVHLLATHVKNGDDQRSDQRSENLAFNTGKTGSTNNDGRDHKQFIHHGRRRLADSINDAVQLH